MQSKIELLEKVFIAHKSLLREIQKIPTSKSKKKEIEFTGGLVSVCDIIAYQIGWGSLLVEWYKNGLKGKAFDMPCTGFDWDYTALAIHFYKLHSRSKLETLVQKLDEIVSEILAIIKKEHKTGNLDKLGVWEWCRLQSGKEWPLSKWIQVNTVAPYKRAATAIRKFSRTL